MWCAATAATAGGILLAAHLKDPGRAARRRCAEHAPWLYRGVHAVEAILFVALIYHARLSVLLAWRAHAHRGTGS
jgi:hypothetical protein